MPDRWAEWLADRRFGGDPEVRCRFTERLAKRRDEILDNGGLSSGETLLDVGCGEGLVAFGALERGAGTVVFSDISEDLLAFCRDAAGDLGVADRCRFVPASADELSPIDDESVDVVTTRSVLIFVDDKASAFGQFFRVLRPGGRVSVYEPINRFALESEDFWGYDLRPLPEIAAKLRSVYEAIQPPDTDPMLNFDERDLVRLAEDAGFFPINLRLEVEITPIEPRPWQSFVNAAGNPKVPTLAEAMDQALTSDEREQLAVHLRPLVEQGHGVWRMAHAYLSATRSGEPVS